MPLIVPGNILNLGLQSGADGNSAMQQKVLGLTLSAWSSHVQKIFF